MCILKTVHGDLFTCSPTSSMAHCVSQDLKMTRGIAHKFRTVFGCVGDLYSQSPRVGGVVYLKRRSNFIYYIVTKEFFYQKPQLNDYFAAIHSLRDLILSHNVTELAIPQLGCGLDRIPIPLFYSSLRSIFCGDSIIITVYIL